MNRERGRGKKAPVISCGQRTCSLAECSLSASSRRQLGSISGSASPAAHIISPWFQQQKNVHEEGRKAVAEKCKWQMKVINQTAAREKREMLQEGFATGC